MGLCRCPARKVSNLFCFEHRVNVCDRCVVSDHASCVVKSYLKWLQDSDYDSDCVVCHKPLIDEECIRLPCYDVLHIKCLDLHCSTKFPPHTAPAGFLCPMCSESVFPLPNELSQVAQQFRQIVTTNNFSWAAVGVEGVRTMKTTRSEQDLLDVTASPNNESREGRARHPSNDSTTVDIPSFYMQNDGPATQKVPPSTKSIPFGRKVSMLWRRMVINFHAMKSFKKDHRIIVVMLVFCTFVVILWLGRKSGAAMDNMIDPNMNPNLHVQSGTY